MGTRRHRSRLFERAARFVLANRVTAAAASALSSGHATVFLLHRFADSKNAGHGFPITTLVRYFEWLRAHRYRVVGLASLVQDLAAGRKIPARTVAFTVDDGYADFHDIALPHFQRFDIPASVFLVTDFLDGKRWLWWDQVEAALLQAGAGPRVIEVDGHRVAIPGPELEGLDEVIEGLVERLKFLPQERRAGIISELCGALGVELPSVPPEAYAPMTWAQVRQVAGDLITFGPHTLSHPILALEPDAEARQEIFGSWDRLRAELPSALPIFCYPNGDPGSFGRRDIDTVAAAGLVTSLSVSRQPVRSSDYQDPDALRRIPLARYSLEEDFGRFVQVVSGTERLKAALFGSRRL